MIQSVGTFNRNAVIEGGASWSQVCDLKCKKQYRVNGGLGFIKVSKYSNSHLPHGTGCYGQFRVQGTHWRVAR